MSLVAAYTPPDRHNVLLEISGSYTPPDRHTLLLQIDGETPITTQCHFTSNTTLSYQQYTCLSINVTNSALVILSNSNITSLDGLHVDNGAKIEIKTGSRLIIG